MTKNTINPQDPNLTVPFFPSQSWGITQIIENTGAVPVSSLPTFSYLQVTFEALPEGGVILCVYNGLKNSDGEPIISPVCFGYTTQIMQFKGQLILDSGVDILGNEYTSTDIGDLSAIYAYGGTY